MKTDPRVEPLSLASKAGIYRVQPSGNAEDAKRTITEYRVLSKRVGCKVKEKRYRVSRAVNDRIGRLVSPEPWRFYGSQRYRERSGDAQACCSGWECGCGGLTVRQQADAERALLPALEWVRVEVRQVTTTEWVYLPALTDA